MKPNLIATRDGGDRLFCSGSHVNDAGMTVYHGYIAQEGGGRIEVPNIDVLLAHGYWDEIVE
jgi:hypothetical protein